MEKSPYCNTLFIFFEKSLFFLNSKMSKCFGWVEVGGGQTFYCPSGQKLNFGKREGREEEEKELRRWSESLRPLPFLSILPPQKALFESVHFRERRRRGRGNYVL